MKDLSERLWPAFFAEVTEQLEALELQLVRRAGVAATDVHAIFRHFHTIKGGCAMMGYVNMGALAHAAEDALDPVRAGERGLDEPLIDALLAAIDALKQQLRDAEQTRRDGPPRDDLVARLRQPAATPAARAPASAPVAATVHSDALPQRFFAACSGRLDVLVAAALQAKPPAAFAAAAKELHAAAEADGLHAIARLLGALPAGAPQVRRRGALIAECVERIADLERTHATEAGTRAAVASAGDELHRRLQESASVLSAALAAGGGQPALSAAEDLLALALLAQLPETARVVRLVCQVLRDIVRRGLQPDATLQELLALAAGLPLDLPAGPVEDAPCVAMCGALFQRLRDAASRAALGRDLEALRERILLQLDIRREWLDHLLPPSLERLAQAVARGDTVAEIEADMENAPGNGAAFVDWLDGSGVQIGNQTVFHRETSGGGQRESTRLRFLAAWPLPLEEVRRALGKLDPAQRFFDLQPCLPIAAAESAVPAGVAVAEAAVPATDARAARAQQQTLRVDSDVVDQFVNRIGELVTLRNMMAHALQDDSVAGRHRRARALLGQRAARRLTDEELDELHGLLVALDERHERLAQTDLRIQGALGRMQEDVLALRVVPVAMVFNRLPRVVRDLGQAQGKQVRLDMAGEDVRVDKSLVDVLLEPLMHLVRNAVDHGLETPDVRTSAGKPEVATLSLAARQQGGLLVVDVTDDGRGLDTGRIRRRALDMGVAPEAAIAAMDERELANLIFLPGFSTAERVTEVSGRGVGMDVVKTRIAQAGGQVDVRTRAGQGTTFTLRLPLSVAIQSVILVAAGDREMALPERNVEEILSLPVAALQSVQGQACCLLRGAMLPVYGLGGLLGYGRAAAAGKFAEIVVVASGSHRIGILVDRVIGRPEVFVRDVHADIASLPGVGGVSILGSGQVVIILDGEKLIELALRRAHALRSLLSAS
ncbi:MAG: chemotaxis protein CheW [Pseudomonadota bacterium]